MISLKRHLICNGVMGVAIIILNYNNYEDTVNCINSVMDFNTFDAKFYVVDNGSSRKESVSVIDKFLREKFATDYTKVEYGNRLTQPVSKAVFIVAGTNDGYACGNNKALEYVYGDKDVDYILILNNDIIFIQDIIPSLVSSLDSLPDAAIVSPLLLKRDKTTIDYNCARLNAPLSDLILQNLRIAFRLGWKSGDKFYILKQNSYLLSSGALKIELPSGSCMLIKKDLFFQIECFDSNTFLYYEENILYKKVQKLNKTNYLIPSLKCVHLGAQSTGKQEKTYRQFSISAKSQRYYVWHYSGANICWKILFDMSFALSHLSKYISSSIKSLLVR